MFLSPGWVGQQVLVVFVLSFVCLFVVSFRVFLRKFSDSIPRFRISFLFFFSFCLYLSSSFLLNTITNCVQRQTRSHIFIIIKESEKKNMGFLFSKLWSLFGNEEHKIVIVGLDNAGKTTILYQFLMNEVVHTSPTIGSNVEEVVWKNIHFLMWDIGGQESLRSAWSIYYTHAEFVILVVDSTDRERLPIIKDELFRLVAHEDLQKASLLVLANKQDIKNSMSAAEISQSLNLTSIKDHGWHIQACCALTGEGLYQGLEWIVSNIKKK